MSQQVVQMQTRATIASTILDGGLVSTGSIDQVRHPSNDAMSRFLSLEGQRAIVTGGAGGIGLAISRTLLDFGAMVAVLDINETSLERADRFLSDYEASFVTIMCDVTSRESVSQGVADSTTRLGGPISILVSNAGWSPIKPFLNLTIDDEDQIIALNYAASLNCCRAVLPEMSKLGSGRIVLIGSDGGVSGAPNVAVYSGAKAGLIGFCKALAPEVSRHGITVNVVSPGSTDTPLLRGAMRSDDVDSRLAEIAAHHPMGRLGQPQDIANGVAFFCSPAAGFITGQTLSVNGGMRIGA